MQGVRGGMHALLEVVMELVGWSLVSRRSTANSSCLAAGCDGEPCNHCSMTAYGHKLIFFQSSVHGACARPGAGAVWLDRTGAAGNTWLMCCNRPGQRIVCIACM
jgi:hypothetical protein